MEKKKLGKYCIFLAVVSCVVILTPPPVIALGNSLDWFAGTTVNGTQKILVTENGSQEKQIEKADELPYWLDGTLLDGTHRVVVSDTGLPPPYQKPGSYEYAITFEEAQRIAESARKKYIDLFGIDPCTSDLPQRKITLFDNPFESDMVTTSAPMGGPHQTSGQLYALVFPAKNTRDKPNFPTLLFDYTKSGFDRFHTFNNVQTLTYLELGYWDASDVPSGSDIFSYNYYLNEDLSDYWLEDAPSTFLVGWVKDSAGNYEGCGGGWSCTLREHSHYMFPPASSVQHEISHIFWADDHGWTLWPICLMSYFWLWIGYSHWCSTCYSTIKNAIWR